MEKKETKRIVGIYDIIINRKVVATSKPCNLFSEGFKKGLEKIAAEHGVSITKLCVKLHRERKTKADVLAAMSA